MSVTIHGASDDLIEIDGDCGDEHPASRHGDLIELSNGCGFTIRYESDGFWRIAATHIPPGVEWTHRAGADEDTDYSDVVTVKSHITEIRVTPLGPKGVP